MLDTAFSHPFWMRLRVNNDSFLEGKPIMKRLLTLWALLPLLSCAVHLDAAIPEELKVLGHFVGEWEGTIRDQPTDYEVKSEWILNGQVVRQKQIFQDGAETLILRGYDSNSEKYFLNLHDSRGVHYMLTGDWNADTKTFTFRGHSGETAVTITSKFRNQDTEDWAITLDTNGNVSELRGSNVRKLK